MEDEIKKITDTKNMALAALGISGERTGRQKLTVKSVETKPKTGPKKAEKHIRGRIKIQRKESGLSQIVIPAGEGLRKKAKLGAEQEEERQRRPDDRKQEQQEAKIPFIPLAKKKKYGPLKIAAATGGGLAAAATGGIIWSATGSKASAATAGIMKIILTFLQ